MRTDLDGARTSVAAGDSPLAPVWLAPLILAILVIDAFLTLAIEVLYLPAYLGATAFPLAGVLAGLVNVLLVLGVRAVSTRAAAMFLPLAAWAFGFLVCASTGPGGDIMLASDWRTVLLLFCGLVPPLVYIYIRVNSGLFSRR
ncbi:hypothetical protein DFR70_102493 [Nocardia tenerifensis]|uniref:Uncharacterized protein n=1 Tax=Nocardia tenerifensis TaxID=228006 RepID=A0A318KK88_9NOCA|nr:hypothetical protein [Nocardia tenerifensis]PXX68807.1 hypothetical protein DFR70_102493 [Nocardia tenerifensis]